MKKHCLFFVIAILLVSAIPFSKASAACTPISLTTSITTASNVTVLQTFLKEEGYYRNNPYSILADSTGIFGGGTKGALKYWKQKNGLSINDILDTTTVSKIITESCKPLIDSVTPKGGSYKSGDTLPVTWKYNTYQYDPKNLPLNLASSTYGLPTVKAELISQTTGAVTVLGSTNADRSASFVIPTTPGLFPSGIYDLRLSLSRPTVSNVRFQTTDTAKGYLVINSPTVNLKIDAGTIKNSDGPISVLSGSTFVLNWTTTNSPTTCTASGGWSGTKTATGGSTTFTAPSVTTTYTIICTANGLSTSDSVVVNVTTSTSSTTTPPPTTSTTVPTVSLKGNGVGGAIVVPVGSVVNLTWESQGATSCTASGGWSGTKTTSSTVVFSTASGPILTTGGVLSSPISTNTTFTITCGTATDKIDVITTSNTNQTILSANNALITAFSQYQNATAATQASLLANLKQVTATRATYIIKVMKSSQADFAKYVMPSSVTNSFPASVQVFVERPFSISGVVTRVEFFDAGGQLFLRSDSGLTYSVHHNDDNILNTVNSGSRININAVRIASDPDDIFALDTAITMLAAGTVRSTGPQNLKVLVILLNFDDLAPTSYTAATVKSTLYPAIDTYYNANSFGKVRVTALDVVGWYQIPLLAGDICYEEDKLNNWATIAKSKASSAGIQVGNYDKIIYVTPKLPGCIKSDGNAVGGLAPIGDKFAWIFGTHDSISVSGVTKPFPFLGRTLHEFGHSLGAIHGGGSRGSYGDTYDVMGNLNDRNFSVANKEKVGFIPASNVFNVSTPGTFTLVPLDNPAPSYTSVQIIKIKDQISNEYYYVGYRAKETGGVVEVHQAPFVVTDSSSFYQVSTLPIDGGVFQFSDSGIKITRVSSSPTGAVIKVEFAYPNCIKRSPTININPASKEGDSSGGFGYSVVVKNNDVSCKNATYDMTKIVPANWGSGFAGGSTGISTVASGGSVAGVFSVYPKSSSVLPGTYAFSLTIKDRKRSDLIATAQATYVVKAPTTSTITTQPTTSPTATISSSASSVTSGSQATVTWSSTNATSCTLTSSPTNSAWSGTGKPTSGSASITLTTPTTFSVQCTGANGVNSNKADVSVGITGSTQNISLTVNGVSTATVYSTDATPMLAWNISGYQLSNCTFAGFTTGSLSGSVGLTSLASGQTKTYSISCNILGGTTKSATASVTVKAPPNTFTLSGFTGQYYSNQTLSGTAVTRSNETLNFNWSSGMTNPFPAGIGPLGFSARWTGNFTVPADTGTYRLNFNYDDGARIWLDGVLIKDDWATHSVAWAYDKYFTGGSSHSLKIEYYEANLVTATMKASLSWVKSTAQSPNSYWFAQILAPVQWLIDLFNRAENVR